MANKLKLKKITAVALCKQGCNPDADIMLYKSLDEEGKVLKTFAEIIKSLSQEEQDLVNAEIAKACAEAKKAEGDAIDAKMDEALKDPKETLKDPKNPFAKMATAIVKMQDEHATALTEAVAKSTEAPTEDIWKGINPAVKKMFEDAQAKADLAEAVVKSLEDEKVTKSYIEKASIYKAIPTTPEELGAILKSVGKVDTDTCVKLEALLKATNELVVKGGVFKEMGTNTNTNGNSAWEKIQTMASEMVTKSEAKITKEQAIVKISRTETELYKQYLEELKGDEN